MLTIHFAPRRERTDDDVKGEEWCQTANQSDIHVQKPGNKALRS